MLRSKAIIWITAGTLLCVAGVAVACKLKEDETPSAPQGETSTSLKMEFPIAAVPAIRANDPPKQSPEVTPQPEVDAKAEMDRLPEPKQEPSPVATPLSPSDAAPVPSPGPVAPPSVVSVEPPLPPTAQASPVVTPEPPTVSPIPVAPLPQSPGVEERTFPTPTPPPPTTSAPATEPLKPVPAVQAVPTPKEPEPTLADLPVPTPGPVSRPVESVKPVESIAQTPTPPPSTPIPQPPMTTQVVEPKKSQTALVYQVQTKGETFHTIAKELLGTSERWREIEAMNPALKQKVELSVGTWVVVPPDSDVRKLTPAVVPVSAKEEAPKSSIEPVPVIRAVVPPQKTVKSVLPLTGTYSCKIEDNRAIALPGGVLQQLGKADTLLLTPGLDNCLWVGTPSNAERLLKRVEHADIHDDDAIAFRKIFYARSEKLSVDGSGRIIVPEELVKFGGLSKEVVFVGVDDHFELWDAARWQRYSQDKRIIKKQPAKEKGRKVD